MSFDGPGTKLMVAASATPLIRAVPERVPGVVVVLLTVPVATPFASVMNWFWTTVALVTLLFMITGTPPMGRANESRAVAVSVTGEPSAGAFADGVAT